MSSVASFLARCSRLIVQSACATTNTKGAVDYDNGSRRCPVSQVEPSCSESMPVGFYALRQIRLGDREQGTVSRDPKISWLVDLKSPASFLWAIGAVHLYSFDRDFYRYEIPFEEFDWWSKQFGRFGFFCDVPPNEYWPNHVEVHNGRAWARCLDGELHTFSHIFWEDEAPVVVAHRGEETARKEDEERCEEVSLSDICSRLGLKCA